MKILPVIMCGGAGTRMWPLSRDILPKQFISLVTEKTSFQDTLILLNNNILFDDPIIITNKDYRFLAAEQMRQVGIQGEIVLEPERRDSGLAVAVAAEVAALGSPEAIVGLFAADHSVHLPENFGSACASAAEAAAEGYIVTLGIKPNHPAVGYGYINSGEVISSRSGARKILEFVEKPDLKNAEKYVSSGYLWNSGNFFFRADVMQAEIEKFEPDMAKAAKLAVKNSKRDLNFLELNPENFGVSPKKSIDYAVMEKTKKAAVVPADMGWSDVGSWSAVHELLPKDEFSNSIRGDGIIQDGTGVHIRSDDRLTAVVGVNDVIVVTTDDAVLVVGANKTDQVKHIVEKLKAEGRREGIEHRRVYRPWGYYQSVDEGERYQVKRIVVKPGGSLSLQKHHHRAEHWIVVKGTAEVQRDKETLLIAENESVYLPLGILHRLTNPGKINLELIEVQVGSYLGENDIVRIEDIYHRK